MSAPTLLAVPNVSEGRRWQTIEEIAQAFAEEGGARLLDVHSDADHHRSVFTLAGHPGMLSGALVAGARSAIERVHVGEERGEAEIGEHPHVGALDVVPIVYLDLHSRGAACAEALVVADEIGRLGVPVFLYGDLAGGRTRAELRRGGVGGLARRMNEGEARADFGPQRIHPTAGATLVAAREPLVAFNLELAPPATVDDARKIAALVREGGEHGLEGLRAIGVELRTGGASRARAEGAEGAEGAEEAERAEGGGPAEGAEGGRRADWAERAERVERVERVERGTVAQVSMNVERPLEVSLREVVEAVRRHGDIACAEIVGLAPRAALEGFPQDVPVPGFDPSRHVLENALGL